MENLPISAAARRLRPADIKQFDEAGYLQALPVFDQGAARQLQKHLHELEALLPSDVPLSSVKYVAHTTTRQPQKLSPRLMPSAADRCQ